MSHLRIVLTALALLAACGGAEGQSESREEGRAGAAARPDGEGAPNSARTEDDIDPEPVSETGTASTATGEALPSTPESYVTFVDPDSGFSTVDVHDADRQIVHFDAELQAMIWAANGDAVGGWSTRGSDLDWNRSGVAFRVRFGTEAGERRAYFTETDRGTICNLSITGPETLAISATGETPPLE